MAEKQPVPCNTCQQPITFKESATRTKPDGTPAWDRCNLDGSPHEHPRPQGGSGGYRGKTEEERREIRRMNALTNAVAWATVVVGQGEALTSQQVLAMADRFAEWVVKQ